MSTNIKFPEIRDIDIAFPARIPEQKKFEKLAQENGFNFSDGNKYSTYAMKLFYNGGKLPPKKKDITDEYYKQGIRYFRCWLGSYAPKHERKEEVCGFILSLISDLKEEKNRSDIFNKTKGDKNAK